MIESTDALSTRTWLSIEQAAEYTTFAVVTLRKLALPGNQLIDFHLDLLSVDRLDAGRAHPAVDLLTFENHASTFFVEWDSTPVRKFSQRYHSKGRVLCSLID